MWLNEYNIMNISYSALQNEQKHIITSFSVILTTVTTRVLTATFHIKLHKPVPTEFCSAHDEVWWCWQPDLLDKQSSSEINTKVFIWAGCPSGCPTNSVKALKHMRQKWTNEWMIIWRPFSRTMGYVVSWYQNVSILDFIGAKDDGGGGDNRSYRRRAKLQSNRYHQQTNT